MNNQINPVVCEELELIDINEESSMINENEVKVKKNKVLKYALKLILHALIHISMLSLLETLFFFLFAAPTEEDFFIDQLENVVVLKDLHENDVRNEEIYKLLFEAYDGYYIDNYYLRLKENALKQGKINDEINDDLFNKALFFVYISSGITVVYYVLYQYIYRKKHFIYKILLEHLFLVVFIGLYELWFFINIVINYKFLSEEELVYYIFSCYWGKVRMHYPEISKFEKNVSITCDI